MSEETSKDLEKLRSLGAQKIHEQTHIALKNVQAILHKSFEGMQKVQLMGFVSILEREYGVDLSEVRDEANNYFLELEEKKASLKEPEYKRKVLGRSEEMEFKPLWIYVAVSFAVIGMVLYFFLFGADSTPLTNKNMTIIEKTEEKQKLKTQYRQIADLNTSDRNESNYTTLTKSKPTQKVNQKQQNLSLLSLRIIPKSKVWVGYIDLVSGKKRQTVTKKPLEINASKEYLLTFGHGYIDIEAGGKLYKFRKSVGLKFLYKEGDIQEITPKEFRKLNKGKLW